MQGTTIIANALFSGLGLPATHRLLQYQVAQWWQTPVRVDLRVSVGRMRRVP